MNRRFWREKNILHEPLFWGELLPGIIPFCPNPSGVFYRQGFRYQKNAAFQKYLKTFWMRWNWNTPIKPQQKWNHGYIWLAVKGWFLPIQTVTFSEQSLVGLKRELVNFMEDLYFLKYIFLPYFSSTISKPQMALISLMFWYRTSHQVTKGPQPSHCSSKVILFLGSEMAWGWKSLDNNLHVNSHK